MNEMLSFDDVLIRPSYSEISSRADVILRENFLGYVLDLPIISSNMDSITEAAMAEAMGEAGGVGALHRFCTIEENIKMFKAVKSRQPIVSLGVAKGDIERAEALYAEGARNFCIDVAHGASELVVDQFDELANCLGRDAKIMVGNFATKESIDIFCERSYNIHNRKPSAFKVGIGGGSMCTTRIVTGCGMPTLASIFDCAQTGYPIVADGGMRNSGDIAKALAAGASVVMLGGMLSGTEETPGTFGFRDLNGGFIEATEDNEHLNNPLNWYNNKFELVKKYRGSASKESYEAQGKQATHRTAEGESTLVPYKGPVKAVLRQIEGGLRSALSYVGAETLEDFQERAKLVRITGAGIAESRAHGVRK